MKKILLFISAWLLAEMIMAQEVKIPGTQTRKITSSIVAGQEYELQIMLPGNYSNTNRLYPVVYLMDSQWDFSLLSALYGEQYYDGFIPPMIIVGVTWGGTNPKPDSLRARDYTPSALIKELPQSGGAEKFLSFMKEELFPFVEKNYRADKNDRTLMGCSFGGLLTMYALFSQPGMFQRYVAASPAYMWDNSVLYQFEKKYAENESNPAAKLFMCVGGVETSVPGFQKLTKHLQDRRYKSLEIESRILENTGHSGTKAEGFTRGLQFVFKRPSLRFSNEVLDKYAGKYQLPNESSVEIKREKDQLFLYASPTEKLPLFAASEKEFYSTAQFLTLRFKYDDNKNIIAVEAETFGGTMSAKKL